MNILHIDEQRGWRGGEQQASYLIKGLGRRGHQAFLAGRAGAPFIERDHGHSVVEVFPLPFRGEWDLLTAWKLSRIVKAREIDILHAHTSHALTYACLARKLAARGKVVASRRVDFAPSRNLFNRLKYSGPDRIVAISACIAVVMSDFGIEDGRLRVVHSAIDAERFNVEPLTRADLDIAENAPILLNVAALVDHKDQKTLLSAMPYVLKEVPDLRLFIAGDGKLRSDLESQIDNLKLDGAVTLLGYRNDVPRLLRTADVFVLSSKEEGLGTSVLDAFACHVPVVATAAGGIPEMVKHEQTGLLSPVGDPQALADNIVRMVQDAPLSARLAASAQTLLNEQFTVDRMVAGNEAVYRELLETRHA